MSTPYSGPLRDDADVDAIVPILRSAFGADEPGIRRWIDIAGQQNFRVLDVGRGGAACLGIADIGQYFGGREVSMRGVYGVATAPEQRGHGHALRLMDDALREAHHAGIAISTLYPATHHLYRRSGYERAGETYIIDLNPASLDVRGRPLEIRQYQAADDEAMHRLHESRARHINGELARRTYIWPRVMGPRGEPASGYVVTRDGVVEGYVWFTAASDETFMLKMKVHDIVASGMDAAETLLRFLADHRSTCRVLTLPVAPDDPLLLLPREHQHTTRLSDYWMTRIVSVPAALEERGYPEGMSARLALHLTHDRVLPENEGTWVMTVEGGRATVDGAGRQPGVPTLELDVQSLAPLFTGFMDAAALAVAGRVRGDASALAVARDVFRGGRVWMTTKF